MYQSRNAVTATAVDNQKSAFDNLHVSISGLLRSNLKDVSDSTIDHRGTFYSIWEYNNVLNEIRKTILDNFWYQYFSNRTSYLGQNWIDFETEISHVIQTLDHALVWIHEGETKAFPEQSLYSDICRSAGKIGLSLNNTWPEKEFISILTPRLRNDLERFCCGFEMYISEIINRISPPKTVPDISGIMADRLISFNYSDTYSRMYNPDALCDYIHGKARITATSKPKEKEASNIVLGIHDYLSDDRKNTDLEFITFKKYYQRIYKQTGNRYVDWCQEISNNRSKKHTLFIFGHSLDITDGDIIKKLICNDNVQTKIYYYRKDEFDRTKMGSQISNLVKIIGRDELIRRTSGSSKTIEFIPQTIV